MPPPAVGRTRNSHFCFYAKHIILSRWEYVVAALLVPPQAVGRTRSSHSCFYAKHIMLSRWEYVVAALLVPPQAVGRTRSSHSCFYVKHIMLSRSGIFCRAMNAFILQRFAQKGNCFRGARFITGEDCIFLVLHKKSRVSISYAYNSYNERETANARLRG